MPSETKIKSELDLGEASQELLAWARKNIREDPDTRCQVLEDFRDIIFSRGECTPHRTDDAFLLRFLRSRKFNLESAYTLLVNYCDFRNDRLHCIDGVCFDHLEKAGQMDVISVPPYADQTGKRILIYKVGNWLPEIYSVEDVISATFLILELAILEKNAQIKGGTIIVDCQNVTMDHAFYMTPTLARRIIQLAVTSHPHRLEAVHVVNNSWSIEVLFNVMKPFLHEKMKQRIFFHGSDMESLHKHMDPQWLPKIYGGIHPEHSYLEWVNWFRKDKTIIQELESLGYKTS